MRCSSPPSKQSCGDESSAATGRVLCNGPELIGTRLELQRLFQSSAAGCRPFFDHRRINARRQPSQSLDRPEPRSASPPARSGSPRIAMTRGIAPIAAAKAAEIHRPKPSPATRLQGKARLSRCEASEKACAPRPYAIYSQCHGRSALCSYAATGDVRPQQDGGIGSCW